MFPFFYLSGGTLILDFPAWIYHPFIPFPLALAPIPLLRVAQGRELTL